MASITHRTCYSALVRKTVAHAGCPTRMQRWRTVATFRWSSPFVRPYGSATTCAFESVGSVPLTCAQPYLRPTADARRRRPLHIPGEILSAHKVSWLTVALKSLQTHTHSHYTPRSVDDDQCCLSASRRRVLHARNVFCICPGKGIIDASYTPVKAPSDKNLPHPRRWQLKGVVVNCANKNTSTHTHTHTTGPLCTIDGSVHLLSTAGGKNNTPPLGGFAPTLFAYDRQYAKARTRKAEPRTRTRQPGRLKALYSLFRSTANRATQYPQKTAAHCRWNGKITLRKPQYTHTQTRSERSCPSCVCVCPSPSSPQARPMPALPLPIPKVIRAHVHGVASDGARGFTEKRPQPPARHIRPWAPTLPGHLFTLVPIELALPVVRSAAGSTRKRVFC